MTYLTKAKEWLEKNTGVEAPVSRALNDAYDVAWKRAVLAFAQFLDLDEKITSLSENGIGSSQPTKEGCDCAGLPEHCVCSKPPLVEWDESTKTGEFVSFLEPINQNLITLGKLVEHAVNKMHGNGK